MKLFDLDSPILQALGKMADLLWLNALTLICCIPIVTIGASLTAMNYVALKIARNEDCYVARSFFKSFKENFRQGTLIGLLLLLVALVLVGDFVIMNHSDMEINSVLRVIIVAVSVLVLFTGLYVFPVLAKFENTIWGTVRNAFFMSIMQFPKTVTMIVLYLAPLVMIFYVYQVAPLAFFFGLSVPAWLSAKMYSALFRKLENQILEASGPKEEENEEGEDERIFRDELDETLIGSNDAN